MENMQKLVLWNQEIISLFNSNRESKQRIGNIWISKTKKSKRKIEILKEKNTETAVSKGIINNCSRKKD